MTKKEKCKTEEMFFECKCKRCKDFVSDIVNRAVSEYQYKILMESISKSFKSHQKSQSNTPPQRKKQTRSHKVNKK